MWYLAMLNLGESAERALPERALTLAADKTSGSMTLSERVHGLFEQLHVPVFRYLLRRTRDSGRAEDITQETFLRLFRHLREDRLLDNPQAGVFTVANNLAVDGDYRGAQRVRGRTPKRDSNCFAPHSVLRGLLRREKEIRHA